MENNGNYTGSNEIVVLLPSVKTLTVLNWRISTDERKEESVRKKTKLQFIRLSTECEL